MLRKGARAPAAARATTSTPTSRRSYDPWDQRLCVVPDGDLFKAIKAGTASVVTDHIDTFTETGMLLESGAELEADIIVTATGLELLFIGGIEVSVDGEPVDLPSRLTYKGMMLEGVPEPRPGRRLHERLVDAEVRPHVRLRDPPAQPHARHRHCASARRSTATPRSAPQPLLGLTSGYVAAVGRPVPEAGLEVPVAGAPELPARLPGAEDERHRRRRHGVLQPGRARRRAGRRGLLIGPTNVRCG